MTLSTQLLFARERRGLTRPELARASGVSKDVIERCENGKSEPSGRSLRKLCNALGCSFVIEPAAVREEL